MTPPAPLELHPDRLLDEAHVIALDLITTRPSVVFKL